METLSTEDEDEAKDRRNATFHRHNILKALKCSKNGKMVTDRVATKETLQMRMDDEKFGDQRRQGLEGITRNQKLPRDIPRQQRYTVTQREQ